MKTRVISATFIVAIFALALVSRIWTPYVFDGICIIAGVVGCIEVARAYINNKKAVSEPIVISMLFTICFGVLLAIINSWTIWGLLLYIAILFAFYFIFTFLIAIIYKNATNLEMLKYSYTKSRFKFSLMKALRTTLIAVYPALLFGLLIILNHLDNFFVLGVEEKDPIQSIAVFVDFMIIASIACSTLTDTFAMLIGSKVKGPKLCPKISPNKTISGAIGGWIFGIIGILGVYMLYSLNADFINIIENFKITWVPVVIFALVTPILEQVGDLIASLIKRKNNVKDYGDIIPGHGGIMDRVDGLLLVGLSSIIFSVVLCL